MLRPKTAGNKTFTQVIEQDETFTITKKPLHIVTRSCEFYGGTFESALQSSNQILGKRHKPPMLIANAFGVPFIFIPTLSPRSEQNIWIAYHAIDNFSEDGVDTSVVLKNGKVVKLGVTISTLYRQYSLAKLIEIDFMKKQIELDRSSYLFPSKDLQHAKSFNKGLKRPLDTIAALGEPSDALYSPNSKEPLADDSHPTS